MKSRHVLTAAFATAVAVLGQVAFSEDVTAINSQYIETTFYSNTDLGTEAKSKFASIAYGSNISFAGEWNLYSGLRLGDECREFTTTADFWPEILDLENSRFSFGGKFTYHFFDYGKWCYENDLLLEPFLRYTGEHDWHLDLSAGFTFKAQEVKILNMWTFDQNFSFHVEFVKKITENSEAHVILSTHDVFRYYKFPSPLYTFGGSYAFSSGIQLHADLQFHCCDMFTTKFFLNGQQFSGGFRFYL